MARPGLRCQRRGTSCSGSSLFHWGRFELSHEHLNQALAAYPGPPNSALALFAGPDLGVFCRSYLAQVLWLTGRVQETAPPSSDAITVARELSHPFSLAIALDYAAMLHVFREESRAALDRAEEAAAVCRKHGFAYYLAWADIVTGWANRQGRGPSPGVGKTPPRAGCAEGHGRRASLAPLLWPAGGGVRPGGTRRRSAGQRPLPRSRFRARTRKFGSRPSCTVSTETCCCTAEMWLKRRPITSGRSRRRGKPARGCSNAGRLNACFSNTGTAHSPLA